MIVYSHSLTSRVQYVTDFLSQYFGLSFQIISDEGKYLTAKDHAKINYSYHRLLEEEVWIHPHSLLFESSIRPVKIECFEHNNYKAFFRAEGDVGFDLFAGIFYLITRYEEYLPNQKDSYGRYDHSYSLAFREGFLHLPLVNIWLEDFKRLLEEKFPDIQFPIRKFQLQVTYDIDIAWSYKNKGFKRNAGGIVKFILKGKWKKVSERIKVLRGKITDPYDSYEWMDELHRKYRLAPIYFFLVAENLGKYDKNIAVNNLNLQHLIQSIAAYNKIGLHPSWASGDIPSLLAKEKHSLEGIARQSINSSRQHFIRFHLPVTYRRLLAIGITNDYSMGYGSINGFRASIATSFYWYDLKNEQKTALLIHPFCFMDANSYYEQKLSPEAALKEILSYYTVVKSVNGTMITIWHNNFLGSEKQFEGWKEVYEQFIETASQ